MKLYRVLNLVPSPPPTPAAVKAAFLAISLSSHPDRVKLLSKEEQDAALKRFLKAKDAYDILKDASKKREYDLKCGLISTSAADSSFRMASADFSGWTDPYQRQRAKVNFEQEEGDDNDDDDDDDEVPSRKSYFKSLWSKFHTDNFKWRSGNTATTNEFAAYNDREALRAILLVWASIGAVCVAGSWVYSYVNHDPATKRKRELEAKRVFEERMALPDMFKPPAEIPSPDSAHSIEALIPSHLSDLSNSPTLTNIPGVEQAITEYALQAKERSAINVKAIMKSNPN